MKAVVISFFCLCVMPSLAFSEVIRSVDKETGLISWKLVDNGFELELIQRLPDQTRAFFQGRGFSSSIADDIATQCVFQTIVKNAADPTNGRAIAISLHDWRIKVTNEIRGIKLKEQWDREWQALPDGAHEVKQSSRIAFRWATFPTRQTFEAGGDYNWGMISFGLPPGQVFDLKLIWKNGSKLQEQWINAIVCPEDR